MIWLDIKELEQRISNDELTDQHGFEYVLAYFLLIAISLNLASQNENGLIKLLSCIVQVIITLWGLNTIYKINKDLDGKDFLKRFFAIYWVIGIRIFIAIIIVAFIIAILAGFLLGIGGGTTHLKNEPLRDIVVLIFVSLVSIINYQLIINSFRRLKVKNE